MEPSSDSSSMLTAIFHPIRCRIIEILLQEKGLVRFSELVKQTGMKSSSLEYHVKQMVENGIINHTVEGYSANGNSQIAHGILSLTKLSQNDLEYFKNHYFPFKDALMILRLMTTKPLVIPDLFSLLSSFQQYLTPHNLDICIGGSFDLDLEYRAMNFSDFKFQFANTEILSDRENFSQFLNHEHFSTFIKMVGSQKISIFILEKPLNFYFGVVNHLGIIFLPDLNDEIDYQKCLLFNTPEGIAILSSLIQTLKKKAKKISISRKMLEDPMQLKKLLN
ncbi:hypothetical protein NEF87_001122 [Candidatus Lokiarchaeum ossiferum]|uniref:DUF7347 domain-containing protein n=1 Tax=Candidatus Lokiarchaeum ossiferum TaxID=2951803 RepID=A0ABY6HMV3_9ARCH|nr:hypothetical protein NEF87_001122 [Candidatus Lokiarchaeum sp. B-35]